jgi:hypothetical protein
MILLRKLLVLWVFEIIEANNFDSYFFYKTHNQLFLFKNIFKIETNDSLKFQITTQH